ncbi:unnamed protein product, partial [Prorocentrum cordatum]
ARFFASTIDPTARKKGPLKPWRQDGTVASAVSSTTGTVASAAKVDVMGATQFKQFGLIRVTGHSTRCQAVCGIKGLQRFDRVMEAKEEREMWMATSEEQFAVLGQSLSQSHRDQLAHARAMANFGLQGAQAEAQQANLQIGKFSQQVLHQKQRLAKLEEQAQQAIMAAVEAKQQLQETEKQLREAKRRAAEHLGPQGLAQQVATDAIETPIKEALGKFEQAVPSEIAPQLQGAVAALRAAMEAVAQQAAAAMQGEPPGGAAAPGGAGGAAAAGAGAGAASAGGAGAGAPPPGAQGAAGSGADASRDVKMVEADGGVLLDLRSQLESDGKLKDPEVRATIQSLFSK